MEQDKTASLDILDTIRNAFLSVIVALITLSVAVLQNVKQTEDKMNR
jgi:hypothetical protein